MALYNTGKKRYTQLIQVEIQPDGSKIPTGAVKNNDPLDPDYIAPVNDLSMCPITVSTTTEAPPDTTTTTTIAPPANIKAYVTIVNNTLSSKWKITGYLDYVIPIEVKLEGNFYNGATPIYFQVIIPASAINGTNEFGSTLPSDIATSMDINTITPNVYSGIPIIEG